MAVLIGVSSKGNFLIFIFKLSRKRGDTEGINFSLPGIKSC